MIKYEEEVLKTLKKKQIPLKIFEHIHNTFKAIELTNDLTIFDIKKLTGTDFGSYYRLRKGKYRAIFHINNKDIIITKIQKREDIKRGYI